MAILKLVPHSPSGLDDLSVDEESRARSVSERAAGLDQGPHPRCARALSTKFTAGRTDFGQGRSRGDDGEEGDVGEEFERNLSPQSITNEEGWR